MALATDCRRALDAYLGMARLVLAEPPAHAKAVAIADATLGCLRHGSALDARLHQIAELLFLFVAATSTASTAYVAEGRPGDRTDDFLEGLGAHVGLEARARSCSPPSWSCCWSSAANATLTDNRSFTMVLGTSRRRDLRYVTYDAGAGPRVGYLAADDSVRDAGFEGDMVAFIASGAPSTEPGTAVDGARLLAPLLPRTLRDFMCFEGHFRAALGQLGRPIPDEWSEVPAYYKGMPDTVVGPDVAVAMPRYTERLDHELELAAVIGTEVRDATPEEGERAIFGYTLFNDLSARDVQTRELPIGMGPGKAKDWDGSNVLGPWILTADEVDLATVELSVRVNGEEWGRETASAMHFSFGDLIAYISQDQTVRPGEVLGSGTATGGSGVELGRQLQAGDIVELEATGLGVLRTTIGQPEERKWHS